ncbi:type II toxin-antitoxin system YoeB family toxin [Vibrio mediterranei]|uniref:Uncharacterized protein n=1 Tax=Vibrio mediterranei TaxID=689 RepID=A0AAN1FKY0_9VIBR|nr:type II toxin-antitoxin system YoeB family toxin [Vibrio mediterranei]ASI92528.1 hypothetical protein BSZ05_22295 [Vibrio mediterranei]
MTNFVTLNESSLPLCEHDFQQQLTTYFHVVKELKQNGIEKVRVNQEFKTIDAFVGQDNFSTFLGKLSKESRDFSRRVKSELANNTNVYQTPLIASDEVNQQQELTQNSEFYFDGVPNNTGLACAYIFDTLAISFNTNVRWNHHQLSMDKQSITDTCEVHTESINIRHISTGDHPPYHTEFWEDIDQTFDSIENVEHWCSGIYDRFHFTLELSERAKADLIDIYQRNDASLINSLRDKLTIIRVNPHANVGQIESLTGDLSEFLSMRINQKDRLVYKVNSQASSLSIRQLQGHYDDN